MKKVIKASKKITAAHDADIYRIDKAGLFIDGDTNYRDILNRLDELEGAIYAIRMGVTSSIEDAFSDSFRLNDGGEEFKNPALYGNDPDNIVKRIMDFIEKVEDLEFGYFDRANADTIQNEINESYMDWLDQINEWV